MGEMQLWHLHPSSHSTTVTSQCSSMNNKRQIHLCDGFPCDLPALSRHCAQYGVPVFTGRFQAQERQALRLAYPACQCTLTNVSKLRYSPLYFARSTCISNKQAFTTNNCYAPSSPFMFSGCGRHADGCTQEERAQ